VKAVTVVEKLMMTHKFSNT